MSKTEIIKSEAEELLNKLGVKFKLEIIQENETYKVQINAEEDAPLLIGRYGETLQSLQRVLGIILFKRLNENIDVAVNINDYREQQKARLEEIAKRTADEVVLEGKERLLQSFSAYERKIIHEYITANYPDLTSYSEGEGNDRRLIIAKK